MPRLLDRRAVQIGGIIIGDAAPVRAGRGIAPRGARDDVDVALLDEQGGGQEGADPGPVGRDLRPRPPAAIGVLIEAVARLGGLVDAGESTPTPAWAAAACGVGLG